ncbi:MAG: hypothetical protein JWO12_3382 [Frankiales bacterium]|nr:hypothetical protein [Frankiales bacterium]
MTGAEGPVAGEGTTVAAAATVGTGAVGPPPTWPVPDAEDDGRGAMADGEAVGLRLGVALGDAVAEREGDADVEAEAD